MTKATEQEELAKRLATVLADIEKRLGNELAAVTIVVHGRRKDGSVWGEWIFPVRIEETK